MRVLMLAIAIVGIPVLAMSQHTDAERITALEADMRSVRASLVRIERKIDKGLAEGKSERPMSDRTLEILLIAIVGGDKVLYWRKRKNGTWTKSHDNEKVSS